MDEGCGCLLFCIGCAILLIACAVALRIVFAGNVAIPGISYPRGRRG